MVSKLSDLIAENLELGDPPARIRHARMTLDVARQTAVQVSREPVTSHIGSMEIDGVFDVPEGTCVVAKVSYMYDTNPPPPPPPAPTSRHISLRHPLVTLVKCEKFTNPILSQF